MSDLVLPYDLAIIAAADQNFDRDIRMYLARERDWAVEYMVYIREAKEILDQQGKNYKPDFVEHPQILFVRQHCRFPATTRRSQRYLGDLLRWYAEFDHALMAGRPVGWEKPVVQSYLGEEDVRNL